MGVMADSKLPTIISGSDSIWNNPSNSAFFFTNSYNAAHPHTTISGVGSVVRITVNQNTGEI